MHKHVGSKYLFMLKQHNFCAQACAFKANVWIGNACFLHRHVGFKRLSRLGAHLLCKGMWVQTIYGWQLIFCAQAYGFGKVYVQVCGNTCVDTLMNTFVSALVNALVDVIVHTLGSAIAIVQPH